jgi:geranylgeranyl diphosphate synthase type I
VWNELRIEVDVGQLLDVLGSAAGDRSLERAERICRYKSAKYSVERPLHLGASLAGGSATVNSALSDYGLPLGEAFQMRDDVIGVFGDPAVTGKPVGGDLRESKPTPLMARAFANASPAQQVMLERAGAADLDDSEIADIQQVIVETGALSELEGVITLRLEQAVEALDDRIDGSAIGPLTELAGFIVDRAA